MTLRVKGDVPEETPKEMVEVAKARSPVYDMVSNPVPVTIQLEG